MESAVRFLALLAVGVAVVVLYVRTGESVAVLVLSLTTLLIGLAAVALRPWEGAGSARTEDLDHWDDTWRSGHDVVWDRRGVEAVAVGERTPRLVVWSRIDGIEIGRHRAGGGDGSTERRRGIRLTVYRPPGEPGPRDLWLSLGPDQEPGLVATDLERAWRSVERPGARPTPDRSPAPADAPPPRHRR